MSKSIVWYAQIEEIEEIEEKNHKSDPLKRVTTETKRYRKLYLSFCGGHKYYFPWAVDIRYKSC